MHTCTYDTQRHGIYSYTTVQYACKPSSFPSRPTAMPARPSQASPAGTRSRGAWRGTRRRRRWRRRRRRRAAP
uniref:Uncharacterized protein n=1 Tax=Arundo donax TaxID=35708 RepID=A0A0A8YH24_ARUDO